jgi:hypothetical protein
VRSKALYTLDSLFAVGSSFGDIAPARHNFTEALPRWFFIVDYEHALVGHILSLAQETK